MKRLLFIGLALCLFVQLNGQDRKSIAQKEPSKDLPGMNQSIHTAIENLPLYTQNLNGQPQEHDVNSIILDIEKNIDSMHKNRKYSDVLLMKQFDPLRHFFLTTTNKTSVASSFLYSGAPYRFCFYNDTALALHIWALKDGETYNLGKMTDGRVIKAAFTSCLLPALKAVDEFKANEIKYIGFSIYYGCKDSREGAANLPAVPYCLTLVASTADLQQYGSGLITIKGMLANAELYISNPDTPNDVRKIQINME
jgi:hypothetical protein